MRYDQLMTDNNPTEQPKFLTEEEIDALVMEQTEEPTTEEPDIYDAVAEFREKDNMGENEPNRDKGAIESDNKYPYQPPIPPSAKKAVAQLEKIILDDSEANINQRIRAAELLLSFSHLGA